MKRFLSVFLVLLLILAGCGNTGETSLYDRGLEVVDLMVQAVSSEEYMAALSASEALNEHIVQVAAGNYAAPKAAYAISFPENALADMMTPTTLDGMPAELAEMLNHRMTAAMMSQVNAMAGVEALAASSLCTVGKTFVSSQLEADLIYLYVYDDGCPVAVTFTGGEDHTVSASGVFMMLEEFPTENAEQIAEFFDGFVQVEKIN